MSAYSDLILAESGLVSYWRLGEASGTSAADAKGVNTGTYTGTPTLGATGALTGSGDNNTAMGPLNGTSQYINVADNASLHVNDVFTLEAWVSRGATGAKRIIMGAANGQPFLSISATGYLILEIGLTTVATSTAAVGTGWHHIVATKNGTARYLYIDDADVTSTGTNATCTTPTGRFTIGAGYWGGYGSWTNATLDEVAFYNTALSAASVLAHYTAGTTLSGFPHSQAVVIA